MQPRRGGQTDAGRGARRRDQRPRPPVAGRFVRIELPGSARILSLAEVEAIAGGKNVAGAGKASQSSVDFAGTLNARRTEKPTGFTEQQRHPHPRRGQSLVELDLGCAQTIEKITVWNARRATWAAASTGSISRARRATQAVWEGLKNPAPASSLAFVFAGPAPAPAPAPAAAAPQKAPDNLAALFVADSCCDKAHKAGKACEHPCCVEALKAAKSA